MEEKLCFKNPFITQRVDATQQSSQELFSKKTTEKDSPTKSMKIQKTGRWNSEEHDVFVNAICTFGNDWSKVHDLLPNRSVAQIRSHAQKFFLRVKKVLKNENERKKLNLKSDLISKIEHNFSGNFGTELSITFIWEILGGVFTKEVKETAESQFQRQEKVGKNNGLTALVQTPNKSNLNFDSQNPAPKLEQLLSDNKAGDRELENETGNAAVLSEVTPAKNDGGINEKDKENRGEKECAQFIKGANKDKVIELLRKIGMGENKEKPIIFKTKTYTHKTPKKLISKKIKMGKKRILKKKLFAVKEISVDNDDNNETGENDLTIKELSGSSQISNRKEDTTKLYHESLSNSNKQTLPSTGKKDDEKLSKFKCKIKSYKMKLNKKPEFDLQNIGQQFFSPFNPLNYKPYNSIADLNASKETSFRQIDTSGNKVLTADLEQQRKYQKVDYFNQGISYNSSLINYSPINIIYNSTSNLQHPSKMTNSSNPCEKSAFQKAEQTSVKNCQIKPIIYPGYMVLSQYNGGGYYPNQAYEFYQNKMTPNFNLQSVPAYGMFNFAYQNEVNRIKK